MAAPLTPISIQARVDAYATPELYEDLEKIPAGNSRTNRIKALAQEALLMRRQVASAKKFDRRLHEDSQDVDLKEKSQPKSNYPKTASKETERYPIPYRGQPGKETPKESFPYADPAVKEFNGEVEKHDQRRAVPLSQELSTSHREPHSEVISGEEVKEVALDGGQVDGSTDAEEMGSRPSRRLSDRFLRG